MGRGRKRKVPSGVPLKTWHDSFDESSEEEHYSQLPRLMVPQSTLLSQDLSPTPSGAPSTVSNISGGGGNSILEVHSDTEFIEGGGGESSEGGGDSVGSAEGGGGGHSDTEFLSLIHI